jgi:transcriptional regulator with XRE-family HTH domain
MNTQKLETAVDGNEIVDMSALWAESMQDDEFRFEIKAQSVAVDLARATAELGFTQAQLAERLNWSPSRVSRILHGATNITLRTLHELASALDLDFDIIYRKTNCARFPQPWETKVILDNAAAVFERVEKLHDHAQENLTRSQAILDTASALNRRSWHLVKSTKPTKQLVQFELAAQG